jgi:hypothetical protein
MKRSRSRPGPHPTSRINDGVGSDAANLATMSANFDAYAASYSSAYALYAATDR